MLLFLNISGGEILVILVVIYLVFGPKKIPELARMLGKGINEMRRATNDIRDEINREINKAKKDINLDIDRGDPLGIKKKMEEAMGGGSDSGSSSSSSSGSGSGSGSGDGVEGEAQAAPEAPETPKASGKQDPSTAS